ncbi:MAG: NAD(P)-dependent oxidoreductase [Bacteroidota bacterium]
MQSKILIAEADDFSKEVIKKLENYAQVDMLNCTQSDLKYLLEEYDVFWFRLGFKIDETVLSENTRCKIIATPVTGIDHIDEILCKELNIRIVCLRGEREFLKKVRATAEMSIGLALSIMRKIPQAFEAVKQGNWERDWFRGNELYDKTIGIIGYGRLGAIVAEYAGVFGMKVVAVEPREEVKRQYSQVEFLDSLEALASRSDLISLHVDYKPQTHHLLKESFFKSCKPSAFFINTSRGGIVDEKALLVALEQKWIKGAALDVLQNEPHIDQNNPLVAYAEVNDNLMIVPHIGGNTYESFEKTENFIADKIIRLLETKRITKSDRSQPIRIMD